MSLRPGVSILHLPPQNLYHLLRIFIPCDKETLQQIQFCTLYASFTSVLFMIENKLENEVES